MSDELFEQYLFLTDTERKEFIRKLWVVNPNSHEHAAPCTNNSTETESGDIYYGDDIYYVSHHKYGIESTGYYILSWFLPGKVDHERKNQVALFELERSPRYSCGELIHQYDEEMHYYEFIADRIVHFNSPEPIREFKVGNGGYYAETDNYIILLPDDLRFSRELMEDGQDPYDVLETAIKTVSRREKILNLKYTYCE
jgi:hypothetical protein